MRPAAFADYLSSSSARLTFPIAGQSRARVRVTWPSGKVQEVGELAADRITQVVED